MTPAELAAYRRGRINVFRTAKMYGWSDEPTLLEVFHLEEAMKTLRRIVKWYLWAVTHPVSAEQDFEDRMYCGW